MTARLLAKTRTLSPEMFDTLLYLGSSALAFINIYVAAGGDYRQWGLLAFPPYLLAATITYYLEKRGTSASDNFGVRKALILGLFFTSLILPLSISVAQRTLATPGAHAQAEVVVIERCGDRVAANKNCYLNHPTTVGVSATNYSKKLDAHSFVPYLPGIVIFGFPNSLNIPTPLRDARVAMTIFTLAIVLVALRISRLTSHAKWRIFQFALVLPIGALPLVTGGDDLPVIALLLLGVILANRDKSWASGLAIGAAMVMKLTAWPMAFILLLSQRGRDTNQKSRWIQYLSGLVLLPIPVISIAALVNPHAFIINELLFPLGLTNVTSPAQSPLLGQALVHLFSKYQVATVLGLVSIGVSLTLLIYSKWRPRTISSTVAFAAVVLALATLLAPATRFGYLLYPCNFAIWSLMLWQRDNPANPWSSIDLPNDLTTGSPGFQDTATPQSLCASTIDMNYLDEENIG